MLLLSAPLAKSSGSSLGKSIRTRVPKTWVRIPVIDVKLFFRIAFSLQLIPEHILNVYVSMHCTTTNYIMIHLSLSLSLSFSLSLSLSLQEGGLYDQLYQSLCHAMECVQRRIRPHGSHIRFLKHFNFTLSIYMYTVFN